MEAKSGMAADKKQIKMGVFGSRSILDERAIEVIHKHVNGNDVGMLVTAQEPSGVCKIAQVYARRFSIPLQLHFLNEKRARGMWEARSDAVIANSDLVLFIHDGKSKGAQNELKRAEKFKKPYIYEVLTATTDEPIMDVFDIAKIQGFSKFVSPETSGARMKSLVGPNSRPAPEKMGATGG